MKTLIVTYEFQYNSTELYNDKYEKLKNIVEKYKGKFDKTTSTLFFRINNSSLLISELFEIMTDDEGDGLLIFEFQNKTLEHIYRYEQKQYYIDDNKDIQWFNF
ncbi:MAG: hypothetical protein IJ525_03125 [Alphaproteobacteria bacterium]|nr:hypothetical protein [Alphaproteobacteria bacterium]